MKLSKVSPSKDSQSIQSEVKSENNFSEENRNPQSNNQLKTLKDDEVITRRLNMAQSIQDRVDKVALDRFEKMSQKISKSISRDSLEPNKNSHQNSHNHNNQNNKVGRERHLKLELPIPPKERRENRMLTNIQE